MVKLLYYSITIQLLLTLPVFANEKDILYKSTMILAPKMFSAKVKMIISEPEQKREYLFKILRKNSQVLIHFLFPSINKGRKILRCKDNYFLYLPSVNKTIKVTPKQKLVNSDFSIEDITCLELKNNYIVKNIITDENNNYQLFLNAKNRSISYANIKFYVHKTSFMPLKQIFYTSNGILLKSILFSKIQIYNNSFKRPSLFKMYYNFNKNKKTTVSYLQFCIEDNIDDFFFNLESLDKF